ncbi:MAG: hypothetical protein AAFX06_22970 [Planctomycetota bacterium]
MRSFFVAILLFALAFHHAAANDTVNFGIYQNCPVLQNESTRVVLCPQAGGRVLAYELNGTNALFVSPYERDGSEPDRWKGKLSAGRFDIGPERIAPKRESFRGQWSTEYLGPRSVRLIGPREAATGVQLKRDFSLDADSSRLFCTQHIENISDQRVQYCHWSRTFGNQAGIVLIPLDGFPRFKNRYVRFDGGALNLAPKDDNIRIRDGFLEIIGPPSSPKLGMDSYAGWFAHQQPTGLLFIKQFPTYPDRLYCEAGAITISTWTPAEGWTCELEPIGPAESLAPGESSSFTEVWSLHENPWPESKPFDLDRLRAIHNALPETEFEGPQP